MNKTCKYLPRCKGKATGAYGVIPVCANCLALIRMKQREDEKKALASSAKSVA